MATRPEDTHVLGLVRTIAAITATILVAFTVLVDSLGRLFVDPTFHVSEVLFASLVAAWLPLVSLEALSLLRKSKDDNGR